MSPMTEPLPTDATRLDRGSMLGPIPEAPPSLERRDPTQKLQTIALVIIAMGVVFYTLYTARAIIFPLVLSLLIAFPLRPLMRSLFKLRVPRFIAATLILGVFLGATLLGVLSLSEPASEWLRDAPTKLRDAETKLRSLSEPLEEISEATEEVEALTDDSTNDAIKVEVQQPRLSSTVLTATSGFAIGGMITISLVFLLLVFGDDLLKSILSVLPTRRDRQQLAEVCLDVEQTISRYLLTYTCINIGLGVVIATGLWLLGMPNPILWGVMAAALNYIPFLGLLVGTCIVFIVAVLSFDSTAYACLAPLLYLIANGIEANVITPMLLGRSMKLSTIMIFVAIVVWGWMWGVGGAIIAVPALATFKIICDHSQRLAPLGKVLSG